VAHDDEKQQDDIQWIDFRHNETQDEAYTPVDDNIRGPYLPDQVDQVNRAAADDAFRTAGETGLAEGGGTYGDIGAGTSDAMARARGDSGRFGTMGGTDLSDTLGGEGGPDQTAGPAGTEDTGDLAAPEIEGEVQKAERAEQPGQ
jgi:hypothetical protein